MRPLTPRIWRKHYPTLRASILETWPPVDPQELDTARGDWDHLVALIQDATGLSSEVIEQRLRTLDVEELGLGSGRAPESEGQTASIATNLRLGQGFTEPDEALVVDRLGKLDRRLRSFPLDGTELELSVKDRDSTTQKVTLECWLPHFGHIVATSQAHDLRDALMEVRDDLWRQLDDAIGRRREGVQ